MRKISLIILAFFILFFGACSSASVHESEEVRTQIEENEGFLDHINTQMDRGYVPLETVKKARDLLADTTDLLRETEEDRQDVAQKLASEKSDSAIYRGIVWGAIGLIAAAIGGWLFMKFRHLIPFP